ncbi:hypothetical protein EBZ80_06475 [bacterium]|nr:hypothetical protein [bacterium]
MQFRGNWLVIGAMAMLFTGCGKKDDGSSTKYGSLKIQFANSTSANKSTPAAPSDLKVKLKSIIVVEDKDGASADTGWNGTNKGNAIKVWANPLCSTQTSGTDGVTFGEIKSDADCAAAGITYFDLNRATSAVNTDLNSQNALVPAGSYNYITMSFLGEQQGANNTYNNVTWAHSGSGTASQEYASIRTEFSAKFPATLTVAEGQKLTVTLDYSLAAAVTTGLAGAGEEKVAGQGTYQPGRYDDCESTKSVCFDMPGFTLSAAAQ